MASDPDTDDSIDVADHVVATSESEEPEETVERLFGEHDPLQAASAQEAVANLFGERDSEGSATEPEAMTEFFGQHRRQESSGGAIATGDSACSALDELRPDGETRHELHYDDRIDYGHCVDGVLFAAELVDHEPVTVRSFDPVSDEPVTFEIADGGREVTPTGAVVSMGMAEDVPETEDMITFGVGMATGENDPESYVDHPLDLFCRNFNAFERRETYEQWAADSDAVSVAIPAEVFASLIRRFVSSPAFD